MSRTALADPASNAPTLGLAPEAAVRARPDAATGRNAPCPCGSGLRYKACCGALAAPAPEARPAEQVDLMQRALRMHTKGRLDEAEAMYLAALANGRDVPDAQHMLGVLHLQRGDHAEALVRLRRAGELFEWRIPAVFHNLGLALAALLAAHDDGKAAPLRAAYGDWRNRMHAAARPVAARVSVVIPSFNHAGYVEAALESVFGQTQPAHELIVIDDGSTDGSQERIRGALQRSPCPSRFVARENRGAATTINEAIAMTTGDYVNVLNSDDRFAPTRLATLSAALAGSGSRWGFSRVALIGADGAQLGPAATERARGLHALIDGIGDHDSVGMSFLSCNGAISTGALFFARQLFDELDGFRDLRYNHDWDFCLRASVVAEPLFIDSAQYEYRMHATNTILEDASNIEAEAAAMFTRFYRDVLPLAAAPNPFAPIPAVWGMRYFERAFARGHAGLLPLAALLTLADELQAAAGKC